MSVRVSEWWGVWWDLICCLLSTVHTLCSECEWDAGAENQTLHLLLPRVCCAASDTATSSCQTQPGSAWLHRELANSRACAAFANYFDDVILIVLGWDRLFHKWKVTFSVCLWNCPWAHQRIPSCSLFSPLTELNLGIFSSCEPPNFVRIISTFYTCVGDCGDVTAVAKPETAVQSCVSTIVSVKPLAGS